MASATDYDERFYDAIRDGCQKSAAAVVPEVLDWIRPGRVQSVVDVGCGEGWWGQAFHDAGATTVVGIDAGATGEGAPDVNILRQDLTQPLDLTDPALLGDGARFDLAVCLEVAEHLPEERSAGFVADLCALAPLVLFSAAMPRQGGTGHINCQPPLYWADLFFEHHYECDGGIRGPIWDHPDVEPWYKSNLFLFGDANELDFTFRPNPALHIIHPDLWLDPR